MWMGFKIFKILYRLNYLGFYFVYYHCNVTTVLELHFCRVLPSKVYAKQKHLGCKKGDANQKQQSSDYIYMRLKTLISAKAKN